MIRRGSLASTVAGLMLTCGALGVACSDDPATTPTTPGADAATDSPTTTDAAVDAPAADTGTDAATDAGSDGSSAAAIPDGTYVVQTWTCSDGAARTIDVKAFALTLLIEGVEQTVSGATGSVDVLYPAACVRTVPIKNISYPSPGMVTSTAGGNRTCTASCPANQCTPGVEPDLSDTWAFAVNGTTVTYTRTYTTHPSLEAAAGCLTNDAETVVYTKK